MVLLPYICQNSSNSFWNGSRLKNNNNRKQTSMSNFLESRFGNPIFISLSQALCGSVLPQRQQIEWAMNDLPPESTRMWPGSQTHLWMRSSFFLSLFFFTCLALARTWGKHCWHPLWTRENIYTAPRSSYVVTPDPSSGWSKSPETHHSI